MHRSPMLVGAVVGAIVGGVVRGALAAFHVHGLSRDTLPAVLAVAAIGTIVGALAGMTARPLLGAVTGAALSALAYLGTLPVALFMQALQVGRTASLVEVLAAGALTGALAGAAGRAAGRRRSSLGSRGAT